MQTVTTEREIATPSETLRELILDVVPFMRAAGFSEVEADGDVVRIANAVGILRIELTLQLIERPGAVLAYEQREGIFEEMTTEYHLEETPDGTKVTATTEFALSAAVVGPLFDATVVKRMRKRELENQFDYLESTA